MSPNSHSAIQPRIIRASAGTGKTTDLAIRFISILARGESPDRILATTFTRKAAGEIQERIMNRLADAAASAEKARALGKQLGLPAFDTAAALQLLTRMVEQQHRLSICTLDSFCSRIARSFSLEIGLLPDWRIADERENARARREAIRALFLRQEVQALTSLVRLMQGGRFGQRAHQMIDQEVVLLYELYKISDSAAWDWIPPQKPLSAEELQVLLHAVRELPVPLNKDKTPKKHWLTAFRKLGAAIEDRAWLEILKIGLVDKIISKEQKFDQVVIDDGVRAIVEPLVTHVRAVLLETLSKQMNALYGMLRLYDGEYERERTRARTLGFSDVKFKLARAALLGELEHVYYRLDCSVAHVLFDEFQDTSGTEWRILEPMVREILSKADGEHSFFCVGDVKQAIYGWRGGVAEIFNTLERTWPHVAPETKPITYRCAPPIIEVVNALFSDLQRSPTLANDLPAVREWSAGFETHATHQTSAPGYVELSRFDEEAAGHSLLRETALRVRELTLKHPQASIGILFRRNSPVVAMLHELSADDIAIPASEEGGNPLTDSAPVTVILSLFQMIDHPDDTVARFHVATSPLGEVLGFTSYRDSARARELGSLLRRRLLEKGYGECVAGWAKVLSALCSRRDMTRLEQFVELAFRYNEQRTLCPDDFVTFVEREKIEYPSEARVRVMTIHKSKGLEFDIVILPELDRNIPEVPPKLVTFHQERTRPPVRIARGLTAELRALDSRLQEMYEQTTAGTVKEALSLLYVAITRARYGLYMLIPPRKPRSRLTYAKVLEELLGSGEEPLLYQAGDPQWQMPATKAAAEEKQISLFLEEAPIRFLPTQPETRRHRTRTAPSALSKSPVERPPFELREDSVSGFRRGTVLHRFFQEIEWLDDGGPDEERLEELAAVSGLRLEERLPLLEQYRSMIAQSQVRTALSKQTLKAGESERVFREQSFVVRDDENLLVGSFDRLVVRYVDGAPVQAEVLDFKTERLSRGNEEAIQASVRYYTPQIAAYCRAARLFLRAPELPVTGALLFVSIDRLVPIAEDIR